MYKTFTHNVHVLKKGEILCNYTEDQLLLLK